ncbi:CHASE2 domain-containing protein [Scytonema millei]|uniref:CHASE2 domain-containing protein n=1 Tax=Scytonema millei VB511283 TaxID=1245923 RepID=A0A9X5E683_9CYAN|nr:CHASE2 domain-containing protein [Scytonema millei]NHC36110.1 CHASE2 domain-containing protein [Scytonema millei VB511283]
MNKLVILKLGKGDFQAGFPTVTAQLWEDGNPVPIQFTGSLPPAPELYELYQRWQLLYQLLYESFDRHLDWRGYIEIEDLEIDTEDITHVSSVEFSNLCNEFKNRFNLWLKSETFLNIDRKLRTKLAPHEEILVALETESDQVRRIPWHLWDFFEDYQQAIASLSVPEVDRVKPLRKHSPRKIRILAVLGNSEGIDIQKDRDILEQLPGAQTVFLIEPQRQELDRWLWDKQGWDMLFFAGHSASQADGETGQIYLNRTDSLTIAQLKNGLKAAIARGLRLAIFNSCDGLGLAKELAALHIPQIIVTREPLPDLVAQEFLKYFLEAFASGESFYRAAREARERLQGLEDRFPCASWLPVICQNPTAAPLVWSNTSQHRPLPLRQVFLTIFQASLIATTLVMGVRSQGILQTWELSAFDALMRIRPAEPPDPRILVVTVTEADVQAQPAKERGAASISDRTLAQLIQKLEQFQPRAIGLDIYRENPVGEEYADLARTMQQSDRFFAVCKASEEDKKSGVAPPPEVPKQRLAFSDVVLDADGILRRQLLAMAAAPPCTTDKSLSLQLATRYLADLGIQPQLTSENDWQIGKVIFQTLEENTGGYHNIDSRGYQLLLNYRAANPIAKQVTVADVFHNRLTADLVKDRIVLIGTIAESFHDYWSTPYSSSQFLHQKMPGVVVQAHMLSQILSAVLDRRPSIWVWSQWSEVFWVWCWSVVGGILAYRLQGLRLGLAGAIAFSVVYGVCFSLLLLGGWIPLIPAALALVLASAYVAVYVGFKTQK